MPKALNPALPALGPFEADSPLGGLLKERQREPEFLRMRRLGRLFEQFHLKYTTTTSVNGRRIELNGKSVVNFGSANYLGLEQHPEVLKAAKTAIDSLGTHAGCSRVFSSHENIVLLEEELSALVGAEKTLVGHNISQIHAGVLPALFSHPDSALFIDRHAHTSMYQAALMAKAKGAKIVRIDSANLAELRKIIRRTPFQRGALLLDGIYSMQGHMPPLRELDRLCRATNLILYVDDAHGIGAFGENGGGVTEAAGLTYDNLLVTGSLQKGLGSYGGFISGAAAAIDHIRVTSKAYIFSGTLQPAAVEGARAAVRIARSEEGRSLRKRLSALSRKVRKELRAQGFVVPEDDSPIVPVLIGADIKTLMAGRKLFDSGIYLNSVLFPAVPKGGGILRISLTTLHTDEQIEELLTAFRELKDYLGTYRNPLRGAAHVIYEIGRAKWQGRQYAGM